MHERFAVIRLSSVMTGLGPATQPSACRSERVVDGRGERSHDEADVIPGEHRDSDPREGNP
jgi:hypothetical protein